MRSDLRDMRDAAEAVADHPALAGAGAREGDDEDMRQRRTAVELLESARRGLTGDRPGPSQLSL